MTSPQNESPNLPAIVERYVPSTNARFREMWEASRSLVETERFPQGESFEYFDKMCVGLPFIITSEVLFRTDQARDFTDKNGIRRQIGERTVAQLTIRFIDTEAGTLGDVKQAKWGGTYLVNQLKRLTSNDLFSRVWTLARNPSFPASQYGYPIMLATYHVGVDHPEETDALYEPEHAGTLAPAGNGFSTGERRTITENKLTADEMHRKEQALRAVQPGTDARRAVGGLFAPSWEDEEAAGIQPAADQAAKRRPGRPRKS